jgi:RHS repeat-associated protein
LATDQPLGITRVNYEDDPPSLPHILWKAFTIVPLWSPSGPADLGYYAHGVLANCQPSSSRCVLLDWKYGRMAFGQAGVLWSSWHGTQLQDKSDRTGLLFRRNRYYDPSTGRFTQEDPIGLAGGLNLYGFAGGDPVNFSDPFGLCPPADDNPYDCPGMMGAFVMLGQAAPSINREVATFLPKNAFAAVTGLGFQSLVGRVVGAFAGRAAPSVARVTPRVIGHFDDGYLELGQQLGAKTFNVPTRIWNAMSAEAQWAANVKFLDRGIREGAEFIMATHPTAIRAGSSLAREVNYLLSHGYKWADDFSKLIPK